MDLSDSLTPRRNPTSFASPAPALGMDPIPLREAPNSVFEHGCIQRGPQYLKCHSDLPFPRGFQRLVIIWTRERWGRGKIEEGAMFREGIFW